MPTATSRKAITPPVHISAFFVPDFLALPCCDRRPPTRRAGPSPPGGCAARHVARRRRRGRSLPRLPERPWRPRRNRSAGRRPARAPAPPGRLVLREPLPDLASCDLGRRLPCGVVQSQLVVTGLRVEDPLVCGVDLVRLPTALRIHGCLNPPSVPRGAFPSKALGFRSSCARPQARPDAPDRVTLSAQFSVQATSSDKFLDSYKRAILPNLHGLRSVSRRSMFALPAAVHSGVCSRENVGRGVGVADRSRRVGFSPVRSGP